MGWSRGYLNQIQDDDSDERRRAFNRALLESG